MQAAQRRFDAGVVERLLDEPYRFQFFQAVRVLEVWFAQQVSRRAGERVAGRIGFRSTLSLTFAPSELERAVSYDHAGAALANPEERRAAMADQSLARIELTPSFFGMLGGQGALPLHYTEQLAAREQLQRDRAAREFFDVFSDRATALFYEAWKKYRLPFHYELDRNERYLPLLLALAGLTHVPTRAALQRGPGALVDEALAGFALPIRHRPMSAAYLARALSEYFRVPVQVEQFIGKWYAVPAERLSRLGLANAKLGATALAGERVWQRDMRARLVVGPLNKKDYEAFLPGAASAIALERMLSIAAGDMLEYEVWLVLAREEVGTSQLGAGARLGWDAFLCTREAVCDRDDARYELTLIHSFPDTGTVDS